MAVHHVADHLSRSGDELAILEVGAYQRLQRLVEDVVLAGELGHPQRGRRVGHLDQRPQVVVLGLVMVVQVRHQEFAERRQRLDRHGGIGGRLDQHRGRPAVDVVHQLGLEHGKRFGHEIPLRS
jgi:hypothetical protein